MHRVSCKLIVRLALLLGLCIVPTTGQGRPLLGFNEMLVTAKVLQDRSRDPALWDRWCMIAGSECTANVPPLALGASGALLDRLYARPLPTGPMNADGSCPARPAARAVHREIVDFQLIQPDRGGPDSQPFMPAIESVIALYAARDIELVLAFGGAMPPGLRDKALTGEARMSAIASSITDFLWYLKARGNVDPCWMATRLRIEPMNEFNAFDGDPAHMAQLDNETAARLARAGVRIRDVVSSSIISGTAQNYAYWFDLYHAAGGKGVPNIHLYPERSLDGPAPGRTRWQVTLARFRAIVLRLKNQARGWSRRGTRGPAMTSELLITEVGLPSIGPRALFLASRPPEMLSQLRDMAGDLLSPSDRVIVWRVLRDWNADGRYRNCGPNMTYVRNPAAAPRDDGPSWNDCQIGPLQAENYTYGLLDYWTGKPQVEDRSGKSMLGNWFGNDGWSVPGLATP